MTYVIGILLTAFMVWYAFYTRLSAKFVIIEVLSYIVGLLVGLGCCDAAMNSVGIRASESLLPLLYVFLSSATR